MTSDGPVPFTPEEEAEWDAQEAAYEAQKSKNQWDIVRADRNQRLLDTDWWVVSAVESGSVQNFECATYRQALRDITTQADPFNIIWPTKPE
jgi:hypothetical protein